MNFTELYEELSKKRKISKAESRRILLTVFDILRNEVCQGRVVKIRNFGSFKRYDSHGKCRVKFNDSDNICKIESFSDS